MADLAFEQSTAQDFDCAVVQGFNGSSNDTSVHGHITAFEVGGTSLESDLEVTSAEDGNKKKVVGVLRKVSWDGKELSPMTLCFQVSVESKQALKELIQNTMEKDDLTVSFNVLDFDASTSGQKFFPVFGTLDAEVNGIVKKTKDSDGNIIRSILVEEQPSFEIPEPKNYMVRVVVEPQGKNDLGMAASSTAKWAKGWGMDK